MRGYYLKLGHYRCVMAESTETYTEEEQKRIDAVDRYLKGERPSKIRKSLGRSRSWLQKWVERYNSSNKRSEKKWFKEKSRAPKNVHRKTDSGMEQLVTTVRKSLLNGTTKDTKYRCIGAVEIQFHMHEKRLRDSSLQKETDPVNVEQTECRQGQQFSAMPSCHRSQPRVVSSSFAASTAACIVV